MFAVKITKVHPYTELDRSMANLNSRSIDFPSTSGLVACHLYTKPDTEPKITKTSVLFGELFDKNLSPIEVELVREQDLHSCIGDFLYFIFSDNSFSVHVSQGVKNRLFFARNSSEYVFSDSVEMLFNFTNLPLEINWEYMSNFAERGNIYSVFTPFKNIFEVPVGCKIFIDISNFSFTVSTTWDPTNYIYTPFSEENWGEEFLKRTRWSLKQSIGKNIKNIFLELSGGLDSSLLGCLLAEYRERNNIEVHAINLYNKDDINSDERIFAKMVSDRFSIPTTYLETSDYLPFSIEKFFHKPHVPSNTFNYLAADIAVHQQASCIDENYLLVSGHGGDSLFFAVPPIESITDAIIQRNYVLALKKFKELRRFLSNTHLQYLSEIIKNFIRYARKRNLTLFKQIEKCSWLKFKYKKNDPYHYLHPIFYSTRSARLPPGKAVQIENYYFTMASCERQLPTLYPLLSQSVVESALAIPTYRSFNEHYNRIMMRKAFEKLAGAELPYRKSKGHATRVFFKGVRKNYKKIMELCMEGRFARNGYINAEKLHNDIKEMNDGIMEKSWYITNLFCAEMFMNEWASK